MYVTYRCEERETAEAVKDVDFEHTLTNYLIA